MKKTNLSMFVLSLVCLASLKICAEQLTPSAHLGKTNAVSISSENSGDGGSSCQLGGVGMLSDGEMTGIELHLNGAGILSFDWKVSSEADWDILSFYEVGSGGTNRISGTGGDWARVSVTVGGGANTLHTFRWIYEKDPISDYVGEDCGWVDAIKWTALYDIYTIVVNNGSGDGTYTNGTTVVINANHPPRYHEFDRWIGDDSTVADVFSSETTIFITGAGLIVTATYKPILYPLNVTHGSGSGLYPYNSDVLIVANSYSGKIFYRWTGDVDTVTDVIQPTTTIVTGDEALSVIATYKIPVTVNNGSGGGWYPAGSVVSITAAPAPMYMEFVGWSGDAAALLDDPLSRTANFMAPDGPANFTATYTTSIARVAGCYGRVFSQSGSAGGISSDAAAGSPSGTPAVILGGSGVVPDSGFAAFETEVWGSGLVLFNWKVSSESGADYLKFKVDGSEIAAISGTKVPWTQISNRVECAGVRHTLRWEYIKNGSLASSADAGWVDDIIWVGDMPQPGLSPDIQDVMVTDRVFALNFRGERGVPYIVYTNGALTAWGWVPMAMVHKEMGESNGVFRLLFEIARPLSQRSCFFKVFAAPSEYKVIFMNWDGTVLKTEWVLQGATATAPAVDPTRQLDSINLYDFAGWDIEFYNVQSDLTVTAQYNVTSRLAHDGMLLIPAGTNSGTDPDYGVYSLVVEAFYMDVNEVTKAMWNEVYAWAVTHGYSFENTGLGKAADHPVHSVNWYNCVKWCNARSEKEGLMPCYITLEGAVYKSGQRSPDCNFAANGYRLPTKDEWEYAARGGLNHWRFPWGDTVTHSHANYRSDSSFYYDVSNTRGGHPSYAGESPNTSPVGAFAPNEYGLYDMAGNVLEWSSDALSAERCVFGGSWNSYANSLRCGYVFWYVPDLSSSMIGFRAVCRYGP